MAGLLPNLHMVSTLSPPVFLNYYLLESIFHLGCPWPRPVALLGHDPWLLHIGCLSLLHFSGLIFLLSPAWWFSSFPQSPFLQTLNPSVSLPSHWLPATFFLLIKANWGDRPSASYIWSFICGISCNFGNWTSIIQALNQTHKNNQALRQLDCGDTRFQSQTQPSLRCCLSLPPNNSCWTHLFISTSAPGQPLICFLLL